MSEPWVRPDHRSILPARSCFITAALVAALGGVAPAAAQLIITNPTGTVSIHPNKPTYNVSFTVDNETGSSGSWAVTCGFTAPVNSCTAPASTGTIANGAIKMVSVSYTVSGTGTGSVTINIGAGLATGNRTVIVTIPNPAITPTGTTITTTPYTDSSACVHLERADLVSPSGRRRERDRHQRQFGRAGPDLSVR